MNRHSSQRRIQHPRRKGGDPLIHQISTTGAKSKRLIAQDTRSSAVPGLDHCKHPVSTGDGGVVQGIRTWVEHPFRTRMGLVLGCCWCSLRACGTVIDRGGRLVLQHTKVLCLLLALRGDGVLVCIPCHSCCWGACPGRWDAGDIRGLCMLVSKVVGYDQLHTIHFSPPACFLTVHFSFDPPRLHKIHEIKEALLVPPRLRRPVHRLDAKLCVVISELPVVHERPHEGAADLHTILPYALQHLGHEGQIVKAPGRIKQLIRQIHLLRLGKHRKAELRHHDGVQPGVVEVVEVGAKVCRCDVNIRLGPVPDIPAVGGEGGLVDTIGPERVGGVHGTLHDRVRRVLDGRGDDGRGIRIYSQKVGGVVEVGEVGGVEGNVVLDGVLEGIRIVDAEVDGVAEGAELEGVEVIRRGDVCGVGRVAGHAEVVVEFHADLAGAVEDFLVEMVDAGVGFDDVVDRDAVVGVEEGFVEGVEDRDAVGVMRHDDLSVVDEGVGEGFVLVGTVDVADQGWIGGRAEVGAVELDGCVEMEEGHFGDHAFREDEINDIVVVVDAGLIDGCARQSEGKDACPGDAEGEVLHAHGGNTLDVLFVVVVVLVGDIVLWAIVLNQNVHEGGCLALLGCGAFDLGG